VSSFPCGSDHFGYCVDLLIGHGRESVNVGVDHLADLVG
jgi:hypothetical protein